MMSCATRFNVGDATVIRFRVLADEAHSSAESTAFAVQLMRPDGTIAGVWSSPDSSLVHTVATEQIAGVDRLVSYWHFAVPPFTVGSARHPWQAKGSSTAGIIGTVTESVWVARDAFPALV